MSRLRNKIKTAERNLKIKQEYKFLRKKSKMSQFDTLFVLATKYDISIDTVDSILWRKSHGKK